MKYNIFNFATSELSHSALWSWILQCTDSSDVRLEIPKNIGLKFLHHIGYKKSVRQIKVQKEYIPEGYKHVRFDIFTEINNDMKLLIENKVESMPNKDKLNEYKKASPNSIYVLFHAVYDFDFKVPVEWKKIGLKEISSILNSVSNINNNYLLNDYKNWVEKRIEWFDKIERQVFSNNLSEVAEALGTREGQWKFLKEVCSGFKGDLYNGTNKSGTPWTQYCFFELDSNCKEKCNFPDALFYRVDESSKGFYLSLRQYLHLEGFAKQTSKDKKCLLAKKKERLEQLRIMWSDAIKSVNGKTFNLKVTRPRNRAKSESEIGWFIINEEKNLPIHIKKCLKTVHEEFIVKMKKSKWSI